jgi:heme exporter protein B
MLGAALAIARKDLALTLGRGSGLAQALLLGVLLIFLFSLTRQPGELISGQTAACIFWLASLFCQVLVFTMLYGYEEANGARLGLLLAPAHACAVWLGKAIAGALLLLAAQAVFVPAAVVFLGQPFAGSAGLGLLTLAAVDLGLIGLGSLLGALGQGLAARESLLSVIFFPLLTPILLAGVKLGASVFDGSSLDGLMSWLGLVLAFDAVFLAAGLVLFPYVYAAEE